jgi:hypothetical protein
VFVCGAKLLTVAGRPDRSRRPVRSGDAATGALSSPANVVPRPIIATANNMAAANVAHRCRFPFRPTSVNRASGASKSKPGSFTGRRVCANALPPLLAPPVVALTKGDIQTQQPAKTDQAGRCRHCGSAPRGITTRHHRRYRNSCVKGVCARSSSTLLHNFRHTALITSSCSYCPPGGDSASSLGPSRLCKTRPGQVSARL